MSSNILVIGIGNAFRGDDAAGLIIATHLHERAIDGVKIKNQSGEGLSLMECWQGTETVFIIDAVSSGSQPGTIFRLDANKESIPGKFFHYSTHAFSVAEAVELARTLDLLPKQLIIYGIEGINFQIGAQLSIEVSSAIDDVLARLLTDITSIKAEG